MKQDGYRDWLKQNHLKICTECKVVLSQDAFRMNKGLLRPNCAKCYSKKKTKWMRGQRASLGDVYLRSLLGTTDPQLLAVKRVQLQLLRLTK